MKPFLAAAFAIAMGLAGLALAGCASSGANSGDGAAASGSGVTVFGTIDAGVSGYSTRSERR